MPLNRCRADLADVVREVASMLQPLASQRQISISITGPPVRCNVDVDRIRQVMTNLVHNAIAYNIDGGTVVIETALEDETAIVRVRDTGVGLAFEAISNLFDRFYRVDESRSRAAGGNGLGLAICKSIIDAHGGKLIVTSEVGKGSTFEIRLPQEPIVFGVTSTPTSKSHLP
jgi:signal transduction histidine kinase